MSNTQNPEELSSSYRAPKHSWVILGLTFTFMLAGDLLQYVVSFSKSSNKNLLFTYQSFSNLFSWIFVILFVGFFYSLYRANKRVDSRTERILHPRTADIVLKPEDTLSSLPSAIKTLITNEPINILIPEQMLSKPQINPRDQKE